MVQRMTFAAQRVSPAVNQRALVAWDVIALAQGAGGAEALSADQADFILESATDVGLESAYPGAVEQVRRLAPLAHARRAEFEALFGNA